VDNLNQLTVVKHNAIIDAGYRLSIYESRILLTCISQINSMGEIGLNDSFTVTAQDLKGLVGLDDKNTYKQLEKAADRLLHRLIVVNLPSDVILKTHWVSSVKYIKKSGKVELKFAQDIIPYISQLRREFTKYRLNNILMFKSNYSIRIYELLVKWGGNEKTITVEWLKDKFQLADKYTRIGNLKAKVLDIAVQEINQHSDMRVQYSQIKQGRNVTGFKFQYRLKSEPASKKPKIGSTLERKNKPRSGATFVHIADSLSKLKDAVKE